MNITELPVSYTTVATSSGIFSMASENPRNMERNRMSDSATTAHLQQSAKGSKCQICQSTYVRPSNGNTRNIIIHMIFIFIVIFIIVSYG